jgi:hypothetical protein
VRLWSSDFVRVGIEALQDEPCSGSGAGCSDAIARNGRPTQLDTWAPDRWTETPSTAWASGRGSEKAQAEVGDIAPMRARP